MRKRKINEKKINELFDIYYKIVDYLSDQTDEFYHEQYNNLYECYVRFEKKISIENMKNVLFLNIYYKYKYNECCKRKIFRTCCFQQNHR